MVQKYLNLCTRIRCRGNTQNEELPNDSSDTVDVFTVRYQAAYFPCRDRCMATAIHATIYIHSVKHRAHERNGSFMYKPGVKRENRNIEEYISDLTGYTLSLH
jgi:hypothetical protein